MRLKLSGPVEFVEALEAAAQASPEASVESAPLRREAAELRFGFKEFADMVVVVKDFAQVVSLCWAGVQVLRALWAKRNAGGEREPASAPVVIAFDITTAAKRMRIEIPLDSTREQVEERLAALQSRKNS